MSDDETTPPDPETTPPDPESTTAAPETNTADRETNTADPETTGPAEAAAAPAPGTAPDAPAPHLTLVKGDTVTGDGQGQPLPEVPASAYAAGGGTGLAIEMARAHDAEQLARAENGVLSYGFDEAAALKEIAARNREVGDRRREWKNLQTAAKNAKKDYEDELAALSKRIGEIDDERRKPRLRFDDDSAIKVTTSVAPPPAPACAFTQRTGRPCPVCRPTAAVVASRSADAPAAAATHPGHDHLASLEDARSLETALATAGVYLTPAALVGLDLSATAALEQWLRDREAIALAQQGDAEVIPLPFLEAFARRAHVAGEADTEAGRGQACTRCGLQLRDDVGLAEAGAYPTGAHVGLDCEGAAAEASRPIRRRGSRKTSRVDPEKERADQVAAGKARTKGDQVH